MKLSPLLFICSESLRDSDQIQIIDNAGYKDITGILRIPVAKLVDPRTKEERTIIGNEEIDKAHARIPGKPTMTDEAMSRWLNREDKEAVCEEVGAPIAPIVWKGMITAEKLPKLADRISSFGHKTAEGIVLKNYTSGVFGKFINLEFQRRIADETLGGAAAIHPMRLGIRNIRREF